MDSKRLPFSSIVSINSIPQDVVDIEVPQGEAHFHLEQNQGTREHVFHIRHPHTTLRITGAITTANEATLSTTVIHHSPHTKSETLIRTLGTGDSKSSFKGMIKIAPGAKGCESYLNHHSLLFDNARSYTWPALEIGNNEVKCSHAATVKTITDLDLFYARSRGLSETSAKKIMIQAFFSDVQS